jgi:hypothetical protein
MPSQKKSCYIQKLKTDNVWGKKHSAADCSTKQNRMACYHHCWKVIEAPRQQHAVINHTAGGCPNYWMIHTPIGWGVFHLPMEKHIAP